VKAYCPACGAWTDDDWTEGPFGVCCWPCAYAYRAVCVLDGTAQGSQLVEMLAYGYGARSAAGERSEPGPTARRAQVH